MRVHHRVSAAVNSDRSSRVESPPRPLRSSRSRRVGRIARTTLDNPGRAPSRDDRVPFSASIREHTAPVVGKSSLLSRGSHTDWPHGPQSRPTPCRFRRHDARVATATCGRSGRIFLERHPLMNLPASGRFRSSKSSSHPGRCERTRCPGRSALRCSFDFRASYSSSPSYAAS